MRRLIAKPFAPTPIGAHRFATSSAPEYTENGIILKNKFLTSIMGLALRPSTTLLVVMGVLTGAAIGTQVSGKYTALALSGNITAYETPAAKMAAASAKAAAFVGRPLEAVTEEAKKAESAEVAKVAAVTEEADKLPVAELAKVRAMARMEVARAEAAKQDEPLAGKDFRTLGWANAGGLGATQGGARKAEPPKLLTEEGLLEPGTIATLPNLPRAEVAKVRSMVKAEVAQEEAAKAEEPLAGKPYTIVGGWANDRGPKA